MAEDVTAVEKHLYTGDKLPFGVVYGLFGLDCEHDCRSEYHPAYAVAIQVDDTNSTDTWAIFARNWGDEGFCSHLDHQLDIVGRPMQLLLSYNSPNPPSAITIQQAATSAENTEASSTSGQSQWCPSFTFSKNEGEVMDIPLPASDQDGFSSSLFNLSGLTAPHQLHLRVWELKSYTRCRRSNWATAVDQMPAP